MFFENDVFFLMKKYVFYEKYVFLMENMIVFMIF